PTGAVVRRDCTKQGSCLYEERVARQPEGLAGLVLAELRTDALVASAAAASVAPPDVRARTSDPPRLPFQPIALNLNGRIIYHQNSALMFQDAARVMPHFVSVAAEMAAAREGSRVYSDEEGERWFAAYAPVRDLELSVAVAADETAATAALRREGRIYVALSVLLALAVVGLVLAREVRASRRIERIARAAREVAEGNLDKRLEVGEHDRARAIADSFNLMTERLREHVRREAEGRQFQAFMRLSAMLTHDLKNAIAGLSMLVANMERKFDDERFRADAVASLREATEKLRGIVARLNKPVETLSGEFRSALKPTDLSALVRRVVEETAGQQSFHEIELRVPDSLEAVVDAERIERVVENLLINALEAMGAKAGRLTVEAGRAEGGRVFVAVADTGAGVSEEFIRTKMFRPFATTKKQGLGLGLYTCREVVEAHGGEIEVESREGSGTRFRVVLPSRPVSLPRAASEQLRTNEQGLDGRAKL
ncbi:MAG: HAMP domain-containing protein, partial [Acidobacteria bacterium]|nr:HAMP domain-containing protein [Acidobacteriota bacterium]